MTHLIGHHLVPGASESQDGDYHVVPINDLREHVKTRGCWCVPALVMTEGKPACIVHRAADGRDLVEDHGIN